MFTASHKPARISFITKLMDLFVGSSTSVKKVTNYGGHNMVLIAE